MRAYDESSFPHDNEHGVPTSTASTTTAAPDIFVAWRYHISMFAGDHDRAQRYLWLQDISSRFVAQYTPKFCSSLHGVFVLSNFHAQHGLPAHATGITTITPNGLDAGYFVTARGFS